MPFSEWTEADFARRAAPSTLPELMDGDCTYEEFRKCLRDLELVNTWTLAYRPTYDFLRRAWDKRETSAPMHIVDVGFGGGELLRSVEWWARKQKVPVVLTGVDRNPYSARAAREQTQATSTIEWVTADVFTWRPERAVDVVTCSLFTHHLEDEDVVRFLEWCEQTAQLGWFINDVYRSYTAARLLSRFAGVARLDAFVRHDGPVSIRRGFREQDWHAYLAQSSIAGARVEKWFPSRLCVEKLR